ncbi:MAG TPA: VIT1/CCC1 transporter family protein [Burkholderiales bacterium]|nr:VIT1/CCC1 transporter family protein [Burkholderiales bacterium]
METSSSAAESLDGELTAAYLYRVIAASESEPRRRRLFEELARDAESQAEHWRAALAAQGAAAAPFRPAPRARLVAALVRLLGARRLTHALTAMKVRGMSVYRDGGPPGAPRSPRALPSEHDEVGEKHQGGAAGGGGSLRAAVFGVNDGLVSNASLILGVAGAGSANSTVLLAGVAGLLAGSFSMAAGEYVSMRSQREMYEYQIALEKAELEVYPEEEAEELALIFEARGMAADEARQYAAQLIADPGRALDTLTREELGLNPGELGSPWGAAGASFLSFAIGGAIPLAPYLLAERTPHVLVASVALSAAALFAVGAAISLFTGRSALAGGLRMLGIGAAAGAITYAIGSALGVGLS